MLHRIRPYIHYLWSLTPGFRSAIALRTLLGLLRVAATLLFVWLSKTAVDCATGRIASSAAGLAGWFAMMVGCMLLDLLLGQWIRYIESRSTVQMTNAVTRRLFLSLLTLHPERVGERGFHSGDMLNRLTLDVRTLASFLLSQLPSMAVMAVQLVASFLFLAWLNPYLALAPVVIMPLCLIGGRVYLRRQRALTALVRDQESAIHVTLQEGLRHRTLLCSLEAEGEMDRRLHLSQLQLNSANRSQAWLSAKSGGFTRLGFTAGFLTAFGWGIFSLKAGAITFGTMTAFLQLVSRIQNPIAGIAGYIPSFISTSVAVDRLREIDLPVSLSLSPAAASTPLPGAGLKVSRLSFSYSPSSPEILSDFSHNFLPGSRTMIVGPTGAGKTTLIKLLLGLLPPTSGRVEIYPSTHPSALCPVSSATLCNFVYVPQGNSLLPGTIRQNLLLALPTATDSQLAEALHTAAADFVFTLPLGLDTPCHESGAGLSEGQAQRIAIARALLRPGAILLLDEFNSALDPSTAATLMERLAASHPNSTIIVIAHHRTAVAPYCTEVVEIGEQ